MQVYTDVIMTIIAVLTVTMTGMTFYFARRKNARSEGEHEAVFANDISYIKDALLEIKKDIKEINAQGMSTDNRITRIEENVKQIDSRIKALEENKK